MLLKHLEMAQTFCTKPNPGAIIIAGSFFMTPVIANASSNISASVLNARKNTSKEIESSSLLSPAAL